MEDQDKLFTLMAHAEDLQRIAENSIQEAEKATQRMERNAGNAILSAVRVGIDETMQETKTGLREAVEGLGRASDTAKAAGVCLRRTGLLQGAFLLGVALVIAGAGYFVGGLMLKSRIGELAELRAAIQTEQVTLAELHSKTWGLELVKYNDGSRGIILPKGTRFDRSGPVQDGRTGLVIR